MAFGVKIWNNQKVIDDASKKFMDHIMQDDIKQQFIDFA
jgi:hypothetical protein